MAEYLHEYERGYDDAIHTGPPTWNVSHEGEPMTLAARIKADGDLGMSSRIVCDATKVKIYVEEVLTPTQVTALDVVVAAQKAAEDWPPPPPE